MGPALRAARTDPAFGNDGFVQRGSSKKCSHIIHICLSNSVENPGDRTQVRARAVPDLRTRGRLWRHVVITLTYQSKAALRGAAMPNRMCSVHRDRTQRCSRRRTRRPVSVPTGSDNESAAWGALLYLSAASAQSRRIRTRLHKF